MVGPTGGHERRVCGRAYTSGGRTALAGVLLKGENTRRARSRRCAPRVVHGYAGGQPRIALSVMVENGGFGARRGAHRAALLDTSSPLTRDGAVVLRCPAGDDASD